jgi:hypothetical protein
MHILCLTTSTNVHRRAVVGRCQVAYATWKRPTTARPTTFHVWKTRGCQCNFRLLMMGNVSPETCWASYTYRIIQILIYYCILLDFLYELHYDARIHEHPVPPGTKQKCPQLDNGVWYGNLDWIQPTQKISVKVFFKHNAKHMGAVKCELFLYQLNDCQLYGVGDHNRTYKRSNRTML